MDYQCYHSLFITVYFKAANYEKIIIIGCIRMKITGKTMPNNILYWEMSLPARRHEQQNKGSVAAPLDRLEGSSENWEWTSQILIRTLFLLIRTPSESCHQNPKVNYITRSRALITLLQSYTLSVPKWKMKLNALSVEQWDWALL